MINEISTDPLAINRDDSDNSSWARIPAHSKRHRYFPKKTHKTPHSTPKININH